MSTAKVERPPVTLVGVSGSWRWVLVWAGVALAGLIALNEIDRLVTAASLSAGESFAVAGLVGPGSFGAVDAWTAWARDPGRIGGLLRLHNLYDLVFVLGYAVLLRWLVTTLTRGDADRWPRWLLTRALGALVVMEVIEAALLLVGSLLLAGGVPTWFRYAVAAVAFVKWWGAVTGFAVTVVAAPGPRRTAAAHLRRIGKALKWQRLTALSLALLATLSLVPGRNLFDQLPDVQRRWLDSSEDAQGVHHLVAAVLSTAIFVGVAFAVGRFRSERAYAYYTTEKELPDRPAVQRWWRAVPIAVLATAGLLALVGPDDVVDWCRLVPFFLVPLVLVGISFLVREHVKPAEPASESERADGPAQAAAVAVTGDVLAFAALAVGGCGLVRSFTAPLALWAVPGPMATPPSGGHILWQMALVVVGVATLAAGPVWVPRLVAHMVGASTCTERILNPTRDRRRVDTPVRVWTAIVGVTSSVGVFAAFALVPMHLTAFVGVTATAALLLVAWSVVLGVAQIATQYAQPLAVFRLLGLRATPVLSLLLAIGVVNGLAGGDTDLHGVAGTSTPVAGRPAVGDRFDQWLRDGRGCEVAQPTSSGSVAVRPMLLVAARGGGIRAAYWTAQGLASLGRAGTCADRAVLLSSGVSGGSVGLALAHIVDGPSGPDRLRAASESLTSPDALAAATAGLFGADVFGNLTGVRVPSLGTGPDPTWRWRDRARLMEATWDREVGELGRDVTADVAGRAGALMLNSTDAPSGCRVLVSQVRLSDGGATGDPLPCSNASLVAAGADYFGGPQCPRGVTWSTAAMLSARFPFVTPAGRTAPCGTERGGLQLVDGGYAESSGLATLDDVAPSIMERVRRENARVARDGGAYVVPLVVDLNNGFGSDVTPAPPGLALEPLVPAVGALNGIRQGQDAGSLSTRLMAGLGDPCGTAGDRCAAAALALRLSTGTVLTLAPVTEPAVTAPLGWTLSADSMTNLETNLRCAGMTRTPTCSHLEAVRGLLDRPVAGR